MTIQRFDTGPRMSQVVIHGDTVYLAGVVAHKAAGESVSKQTQEVLSIIDSHLAKANSDKSKLLTATIYLTDMKTFTEMNAVWEGWVSAGNTPARATVEAKLATPQFNVEIMVTAARERAQTSVPRKPAARAVASIKSKSLTCEVIDCIAPTFDSRFAGRSGQTIEGEQN